MLTHCCSSASNGHTWGDCIDAVMDYWNYEPYDNAIRKPALRCHKVKASYELAFKVYSEMPSKSLYYISKILGTKKMKAKVTELKDYVI